MDATSLVKTVKLIMTDGQHISCKIAVDKALLALKDQGFDVEAADPGSHIGELRDLAKALKAAQLGNHHPMIQVLYAPAARSAGAAA